VLEDSPVSIPENMGRYDEKREEKGVRKVEKREGCIFVAPLLLPLRSGSEEEGTVVYSLIEKGRRREKKGTVEKLVQHSCVGGGN